MFWACVMTYFVIGFAVFFGVLAEEPDLTWQGKMLIFGLSMTWLISVPLTLILSAVKGGKFRPK